MKVVDFVSRKNCSTSKECERIDECIKPQLLCLVDVDEASENLVKTLGTKYKIENVSTTFAAMQALKTQTPSALIVQLHLKDENCFDFLRMLACNPAWSKIPTITCCVADVFDKNIEEYLIRSARAMGSRLYISCTEFYSSELAAKVAPVVSSQQIKLAS